MPRAQRGDRFVIWREAPSHVSQLTLVANACEGFRSHPPRCPQATRGSIDDLQHTDYITTREGPARVGTMEHLLRRSANGLYGLGRLDTGFLTPQVTHEDSFFLHTRIQHLSRTSAFIYKGHLCYTVHLLTSGIFPRVLSSEVFGPSALRGSHDYPPLVSF
jgi:hypothetical protein